MTLQVLTAARPLDLAGFFAQPLPALGTPAGEAWRRHCAALAEQDSDGFFLSALRALDTGSEPEQYTALAALQVLGVEAWGEGHGPNRKYLVRMPTPGGGLICLQPARPPASTDHEYDLADLTT